MLESAATKREAKAYLSRFGPQKVVSRDPTSRFSQSRDAGVNLGNLYLPLRATDNAVVSSKPVKSPLTDEAVDVLHVALVKIRASQSINDVVLHGVGHTLSQLARLGMHCIVVIDPEDGQHVKDQERTRTAVAQADRVVDVINAYSSQSARRLDSVVGVASINEQSRPPTNFNRRVRITDGELLLAPLRRGVIPVIATVGFTSDNPRHVAVDADEVMLGLTQEFTGLHIQNLNEDDPEEVAEKIRILQKQISLDRIIVLDPLGGIPADHRMHGSHVFINLDQEFEDIKKDLLNGQSRQLATTGSFSQSNDLQHHTSSTKSSSKFPANASATAERLSLERANADKSGVRLSSTEIHVKNMELMRNTLAFLPPSSSAFLITSDDVANSQSRPPLASKGPSVRTRRQRNPLIHNLLTDKPVYSSSLPASRSSNKTANVSPPVVTSSPATFFKRGMPLGLIPDPLAKPWAAPSPSDPSISMFDPRIDLPRLVHLIDDSFGRKLDATHYLYRIKNRIAGVIIAGEYEGGAILTWETPPGYPMDDPSHMVPYLDKFAVLKRSQGSGGVADIVFNAMVRGCFPEGVCWRSRKDNPINKWYFERAKGTHKIPHSNWTMFWTTEGIIPGDGLFLDYKGVCETVQPSWADIKSVID